MPSQFWTKITSIITKFYTQLNYQSSKCNYKKDWKVSKYLPTKHSFPKKLKNLCHQNKVVNHKEAAMGSSKHSSNPETRHRKPQDNGEEIQRWQLYNGKRRTSLDWYRSQDSWKVLLKKIKLTDWINVFWEDLDR